VSNKWEVIVRGVWGEYLMGSYRWRWLARWHAFWWCIAPNALDVYVRPDRK
jgi:hypothetical protein